MSSYTTSVRYICEYSAGLSDSEGYLSVNEIIGKAIPVIFDFDFPIFDEAYRDVLCSKILKHYYTREIGLETVGLWKLKLDTKLNEVMPYYNKLYKSELLEFNPLYTTDLTKSSNGNKNTNDVVNTKDTGNTHNVGNGNTSSMNAYSDTPQGSLTAVKDLMYLTNARNIEDSVHSETDTDTVNNKNSNRNVVNTEDYLERVVGYSSTNPNTMLMDYRNTFINIDMQIIEELSDLFMGLWE